MSLFRTYGYPLLLGLAIYASIRLISDTTEGDKFWRRPLATNLIEIVTVILAGFLFDLLLRYYIRRFNRQHKQLSGKEAAREYGQVFLAFLALLNAIFIPLLTFTDDGMQLNDFVIVNIVASLYSMLYYAVARGNDFIKAYGEQQVQLEKIRNDQLQTELKLLKAQYHPHFLFNALNTIYFQMDSSVEQAKGTIEKLAELLRYQLYDREQMVTVDNEFKYLLNFIDFQQTRTSSKLKLSVHLDDKLKQEKIYPLLFLPLIENAFKYVGGDYELNIHAAREGDAIVFTVTNSLPVQVVQKAPGIGLENLERRLELLYPGRHQLTTRRKDSTFYAALKLEFPHA